MPLSYWITRLDKASQRRQGSILIFVLVLLAIIASLLVQSQLQVRGRLTQAAQGLNEARMQAALTDGVLHALQLLADDDNLLMDHPSDPWAAPIEYMDPADVSVSLYIEDLNRHFDLNSLSIKGKTPVIRPVEEIMIDLLAQCGDLRPSDRLQSLQDWVDADQEGYRETPFYEGKVPPYEVSDRWLSSWGELNWVNGFARGYFNENMATSYDKDYHHAFLNTFSLIPVSRKEQIKINLNTAPRHVLIGVMGLAMTPFVDTIVGYRKNNPIPSMESLKFQLQEPMATNLKHYFDVKSDFFSVIARAYLAGHSASAQAWVHRLSSGDVEVIRWVK